MGFAPRGPLAAGLSATYAAAKIVMRSRPSRTRQVIGPPWVIRMQASASSLQVSFFGLAFLHPVNQGSFSVRGAAAGFLNDLRSQFPTADTHGVLTNGARTAHV